MHNSNSRDTRWNPNMNIETSTTQSHFSKAMNDFIDLSLNKLTSKVTKSEANRRLQSLISVLKLETPLLLP